MKSVAKFPLTSVFIDHEQPQFFNISQSPIYLALQPLGEAENNDNFTGGKVSNEGFS